MFFLDINNIFLVSIVAWVQTCYLFILIIFFHQGVHYNLPGFLFQYIKTSNCINQESNRIKWREFNEDSSGLRGGLQKPFLPGTSKCDLIWNKFFADAIKAKISGWELPRLGVVLKSMIDIFKRDQKHNKQKKTQRGTEKKVM